MQKVVVNRKSQGVDIELHASCAVNEYENAKGSLKKLIRIVENLVDNAVEAYEGANAPKVIVEISRPNNALKVSIKDKGGILTDQDFLKATLERGHTTKASGHGLGLYLSNKYLKQINSELRLENTGDAKTISFLIPNVLK